MTAAEVREIVRSQAVEGLTLVNDHRICLRDALVQPVRLTVIDRVVKKGKVRDTEEVVWLVGRERVEDGYTIVMRETDCQFGLASTGFPHDKHQVMVGWYGSLITAFMGM